MQILIAIKKITFLKTHKGKSSIIGLQISSDAHLLHTLKFITEEKHKPHEIS